MFDGVPGAAAAGGGAAAGVCAVRRHVFHGRQRVCGRCARGERGVQLRAVSRGRAVAAGTHHGAVVVGAYVGGEPVVSCGVHGGSV